jgi:hypothetical protein
MRDITIETYSSVSGEARPSGLIPGSENRASAALPVTAVEGAQLNSLIYSGTALTVPTHLKLCRLENCSDE